MARKGKGRRGMPFGGQQDMLKQAMELQQKLLEAQEALGDETVEVSAGGGVVKVVMTGHQKLQSITIDPELLDPDDVEMLQDLIVAAVNEAVDQSQHMAQERLGALTGGLGMPGLI